MTPPSWLDRHGRRVPTRSCWHSGAETPDSRFRADDLQRHGWLPTQTFRIAGWCGCSQEYLPVPAGGAGGACCRSGTRRRRPAIR
jgi:hypothetical protein